MVDQSVDVERRMHESSEALHRTLAREFEPVFLTVRIDGGPVIIRAVHDLQRVNAAWRAWDSRKWWQRLAIWRQPPGDARLRVEELMALQTYESERSMKSLMALSALLDPRAGQITGWTP